MKDLLFKYKNVAEGVSQPTPLNIICADRADTFLGFAVSYKYVASYFHPIAKNEVNVLQSNIIFSLDFSVDVS